MFGKTGSRKRNIGTPTSTQLFVEAFGRSSKHKAHKTDLQVPYLKKESLGSLKAVGSVLCFKDCMFLT